LGIINISSSRVCGICASPGTLTPDHCNVPHAHMPHPADKLSHSCHNGPPLLHKPLSLLLLLLLLLLFSACATLAQELLLTILKNNTQKSRGCSVMCFMNVNKAHLLWVQFYATSAPLALVIELL
jgi:hypothetical protein